MGIDSVYCLYTGEGRVDQRNRTTDSELSPGQRDQQVQQTQHPL